jgi:hypothetical protein
LRELLEYTAEMGSILNSKKGVMNVSRDHFNTLKHRSFCKTMLTTQCIMEFCQSFYQSQTNNESTPFVNVLHDVWSKEYTEVLGVSIRFIEPTNFIYFRSSIGLQVINSHNSHYIIHKVNEMLSRMNIRKNDIWRSVNDNANSAKFVGRLLASNRGPIDSKSTCIMHTGNLILEYALGVRNRRKNKTEQDLFLAGNEILKKVQTVIQTMMNKRNKAIFHAYSIVCKEKFGGDALKFILPNETRVAGKYLMLQSLVRQREAFVYFTAFDNNAYRG